MEFVVGGYIDLCFCGVVHDLLVQFASEHSLWTEVGRTRGEMATQGVDLSSLLDRRKSEALLFKLELQSAIASGLRRSIAALSTSRVRLRLRDWVDVIYRFILLLLQQIYYWLLRVEDPVDTPVFWYIRIVQLDRVNLDISTTGLFRFHVGVFVEYLLVPARLALSIVNRLIDFLVAVVDFSIFPQGHIRMKKCPLLLLHLSFIRLNALVASLYLLLMLHGKPSAILIYLIHLSW